MRGWGHEKTDMLHHRAPAARVRQNLAGQVWDGFENLQHRARRHEPADRIDQRHHGGSEASDPGLSLTHLERSAHQTILAVEQLKDFLKGPTRQWELVIAPAFHPKVNRQGLRIEHARSKVGDALKLKDLWRCGNTEGVDHRSRHRAASRLPDRARVRERSDSRRERSAKLVWSGIVQGFSVPPLLFMMMVLANDREVMGKRVNGRLANLLGWATTGITFPATACLVVTWFF